MNNKYIMGVMLFAIVIGTFLLRTLGQLDQIFVDGEVIFRGNDAYYHLRLIENMMANFPVPLSWDMYAAYPSGYFVGYYPLLSWLVAGPSLLFNLNYEIVAAWYPPIAGALLIIPAFFLAKIVTKSNLVSFVAVVLIAILPTELFHRTLLGFSDHHALEVLLATCTILFVILATRNKLYRLWPILAGLSLGLYYWTWMGGILLLLPIAVWGIGSIIYYGYQRREIDWLLKLLLQVVGIAFIMALPLPFLVDGGTFTAVVAGVVLITSVLVWIVFKTVLNPKIGLALVGGLFLVAGASVVLVLPQTVEQLQVMFVGGLGGSSVEEVQPTTFSSALMSYGICLFLLFGGLLKAPRDRVHPLFLIWTGLLLIITIAQRRWGYYFTINVAILSGIGLWWLVEGVNKTRRLKETLLTVAISITVLLSSVNTYAMSTLKNSASLDWMKTCAWIKENTEDPFPKDAYLQLNTESASYGILTWWDYGHWLIYKAHRPPVASPTVPSKPWLSDFLTASSEEEALSILQEQNLNIKYIIVTKDMITDKWWAISSTADFEQSLQTSLALKLWKEETTVFKLFYNLNDIKVYVLTR